MVRNSQLGLTAKVLNLLPNRAIITSQPLGVRSVLAVPIQASNSRLGVVQAPNFCVCRLYIFYFLPVAVCIVPSSLDTRRYIQKGHTHTHEKKKGGSETEIKIGKVGGSITRGSSAKQNKKRSPPFFYCYFFSHKIAVPPLSIDIFSFSFFFFSFYPPPPNLSISYAIFIVAFFRGQTPPKIRTVQPRAYIQGIKLHIIKCFAFTSPPIRRKIFSIFIYLFFIYLFFFSKLAMRLCAEKKKEN